MARRPLRARAGPAGAALWLAALAAGCGDEPRGLDFARCSTREVAMPLRALSVHHCPLAPAVGGVDGLRFIEMDAGVANVMAFAGPLPVPAVPPALAPAIVAYGAQRFGTLSVHLPPDADPAPWRAAGWTLSPAGSTGLRAVWRPAGR